MSVKKYEMLKQETGRQTSRYNCTLEVIGKEDTRSTQRRK